LELLLDFGRMKENRVPPPKNPNPTEAPWGRWIIAERRKGPYPKTTSRSGKWLIFVHVERVDEAWRKVRQATEDGLLGDRSKVATGRESTPLAKDPNAKAIVVWTYDWKDEDDVMRVREELRKLGFTETLAYKTDADTKAGNYSKNVGQKVDKYVA
jgi:hypothetical protein